MEKRVLFSLPLTCRPIFHYPATVNGETSAGPARPRKIQIERAYRLLNRSLEDFYEADYEHAIERCGEALAHLLPQGPDPAVSPEETGRRFLKFYSDLLPVREAEDIAGVFTFFQSRMARFRYERGTPLPERDWWKFIRVSREEADRVVRATRLALSTIEKHAVATE